MTDMAVYLLPGMQIKVTVPDFYVGHGERKIEKSDGTVEPRTLENGYLLEDPIVGTLTKVDNEPAIIYSHKKFASNKIVFYGRNPGETGTISVISVPIHSHDSIIGGGPAFGTYFSDDETQVNTGS